MFTAGSVYVAIFKILETTEDLGFNVGPSVYQFPAGDGGQSLYQFSTDDEGIYSQEHLVNSTSFQL